MSGPLDAPASAPLHAAPNGPLHAASNGPLHAAPIGPLEIPPPPPRPKRLNRLALVAVLVLLGVAITAVFLTLAPPRRAKAAAADGAAAEGAAPPRPAFLEREPTGTPPARPRVPADDPRYWREALRREQERLVAAGAGGAEGWPSPPPLPPGLDGSDSGGQPGAAAGRAAGGARQWPAEPASGGGRGASPPQAAAEREDAFRRALQAPVWPARAGAPGRAVTAAGELAPRTYPPPAFPAALAWGGAPRLSQAEWSAVAAAAGGEAARDAGGAEPADSAVPEGWVPRGGGPSLLAGGGANRAGLGEAPAEGGAGPVGGGGLAAWFGGLTGPASPEVPSAGAGASPVAPGPGAVGAPAAPSPGTVAAAAPARDHQDFLRGAEALVPAELRARWDRAGAGPTVPAGTVIPAALLTAVDSDVAGPVVAQVTRDVFDREQRQVVIPRGSRLIGAYDSRVALGESRLLVAWSRVIFPDGSGLSLPGLPAATRAGEAGLPGAVDNHLARVFGNAILLSIVSAGAQLSQPQESALFGAAASTRQVAAAAVGQELSTVAVEMLRRQLAVPPTVRIAAGTSFYVMLRGDLRVERGIAE